MIHIGAAFLAAALSVPARAQHQALQQGFELLRVTAKQAGADVAARAAAKAPPALSDSFVARFEPLLKPVDFSMGTIRNQSEFVPSIHVYSYGEAAARRQANGEYDTMGLNLGFVSFHDNGSRTLGPGAFDDMNSIVADIRFLGMSDDGRRLKLRVLYYGAFIQRAKLLASGRDRFELDLELEPERCDGQPLTQAPDPNEPIEKAIERFARAEFRRYMRCDFQVAVGVIDDVPDRQFEYREQSARVSIIQNGDFIASGSLQMVYRPVEPTAPDGAEPALKAAGLFVGLLKDYGNLLILTSRGDELQRAQAVKAFLAKEGPRMAELLRGLNADFDKLSLLQRIWVLKSVNQTYADVKAFEGRFARQYNLDRTLRSYGN